MGFFKKIIDGLKKTQQNIGFQIKKLFKVGIFNDDFYENLEEILLTSDVGAQATEEIVDNLKEKSGRPRRLTKKTLRGFSKRLFQMCSETSSFRPIILASYLL